MEPDELITLLHRERVVADERRLTLTSQFLDEVNALSEEIIAASGNRREDTVAPVAAEDDPVKELIRLSRKDPYFVAIYGVLRERLPRSPADVLMEVAISLYFASTDVTNTAGSPNQFVPILAEQLDLVLELFPRVVLYIWRDDCDPCETMKREFNELFDGQPSELALFSMFGPNASRTLYDRFSVVGGPTTLFIHRSKVFSRLVGAQYRSRLRSEIESLRQRSSSDGD